MVERIGKRVGMKGFPEKRTP